LERKEKEQHGWEQAPLKGPHLKGRRRTVQLQKEPRLKEPRPRERQRMVQLQKGQHLMGLRLRVLLLRVHQMKARQTVQRRRGQHLKDPR